MKNHPALFLEHHYGDQVYLLNDVYHSSLLAKLCHPSTLQPQINQATAVLYKQLLSTAVNQTFDFESFSSSTRMEKNHPENPLQGTRVKPEQKVVCVDLARAGIYPSQICYEQLHWVIPPEQLRQDHIFASRQTNSDHSVVSTHLGSHKIGGDVTHATVLFPDPMGATGTTIISAIDFYKKEVLGPAKQFLALHLIVTPEYLKQVTTAHRDVKIFAFRLDRGLSNSKVLSSTPGTFWSEERGLNDFDYIVPGAGGFGEIMNNSYV